LVGSTKDLKPDNSSRLSRIGGFYRNMSSLAAKHTHCERGSYNQIYNDLGCNTNIDKCKFMLIYMNM